MADYQSSYTGAQLDAAIASYANRTTGQIILTPDVLTSSLSDGYYSGVSASFDYSNLTAESFHVLSGKSAVGKYGKITDGGIPNRGAGSITLDKDNLSKSISGGYYSGVSASFDGTGLNATAGGILQGTTALTSSGVTPGTMTSGTVSLTLTPSNLTPSTSPNKYVTGASASLNYSSLTAEDGTVASGKTYIGKNGVSTGTLVAVSIQSGEGQRSATKKFAISGLTGSPSNLILFYSGGRTSAAGVAIIQYVGGELVLMTKSGSSWSRTTSGTTVTFNASNGTCDISSNYEFAGGYNADKYTWYVW